MCKLLINMPSTRSHFYDSCDTRFAKYKFNKTKHNIDFIQMFNKIIALNFNLLDNLIINIALSVNHISCSKII